MTRRAIVFAFLGLSVLGVLTPRSSAGSITFTGDASDTLDLGVGGGENTPVDSTTFADHGNNGVPVTGGGFSITDGAFTYTSGPNDVGEELSFTWISDRPLTYQAGTYFNTTSLTGTVTIPMGWAITSFKVMTETEAPGFMTGTEADVSIPPLAGPATEFPFTATDSSPTFTTTDTTNGNLIQSGDISFTVGAADQTIEIDWPNSSTSLTFAIPEPSTGSLLCIALVALLVASRSRLSGPYSSGQ